MKAYQGLEDGYGFLVVSVKGMGDMGVDDGCYSVINTRHFLLSSFLYPML